MTEKTLRRYAITGGIGSGKSTVAAMFARLGAVIIDADAISRDLMRPTENTLNAVVAEFGPDILHPDGTLNRPALAALVFSDEDARTRLNNIVHPAVRARADALVEQAWRAPGFSGIIIDDIPLLAETNRALFAAGFGDAVGDGAFGDHAGNQDFFALQEAHVDSPWLGDENRRDYSRVCAAVEKAV